MPETAPLDVSEATVGYELDSITLRDIASVRYVRHHEWLDHLLGSPLPTSAIIPPKITKALNEDDIVSRTKQLEAEIAELEAEKKEGWKFHLDENKAHVLSSAIHELRDNFGSGSVQDARSKVESLLGAKIVEADAMRPVHITYDRQQVEKEQAKIAKEKRQQQQQEQEQQRQQQEQEQQEQSQPPQTQESTPTPQQPGASESQLQHNQSQQETVSQNQSPQLQPQQQASSEAQQPLNSPTGQTNAENAEPDASMEVDS